jgi:hypothetical protein
MNEMVRERVKQQKKLFPDLIVRPSKHANKKFDAVFSYKGRKVTVQFGSSQHSDYTFHQDKIRRANFRKRFKTQKKDNRLSYRYPLSGLYWSWNILW